MSQPDPFSSLSPVTLLAVLPVAAISAASRREPPLKQSSVKVWGRGARTTTTKRVPCVSVPTKVRLQVATATT